MSSSPRGLLNPFNVLALLLVLFSCGMVLCAGAVFAYPDLIPADFRPPTAVAITLPTLVPSPTKDVGRTPVLTSTPSVTHTPAWNLPPSWTPVSSATVSATPTSTATPNEVVTPTLSPSPTSTSTVPPTLTPTPTPTATGPTPTRTNTKSPWRFNLQNGSPSYTTNWNSAGCNWLGIAGQAHDLNDNPVLGLFVHIEGNNLNYEAVTGSKPAYGPGGYELYLGERPIQTTNVYRIQLRNNSGVPLSDTYVINTYAECSKNLILVNFVQNH